MTLYLSNLADFSATATEKINDTEATKIEGTLKKDVLQKVLAESGMTETAAAMGVTEEQLAALTESVKSLPLTLWIDADGYVLKYEMNLTEVMQKIMDKAMEAAGSTDASSAVKVEKTSISMVCSQFNAVKEITIPEEAKSAEKTPKEISFGIFLCFMMLYTLATPSVTFSPLIFHSLLSSPPLPATTSTASTSPLMSFAARISAILALPS